jgi:tripartite-type tricarboxylate transporter receptor subunit TctC
MRLPRRTFLQLPMGAAAFSIGSRIARAQVYPSRAITMIVPFPAGGPSDTVARIMAEHMGISLGQSIIVDNISGASGSIGVGRAVRAAGDGYTLSFGSWSTHVVNVAILALPYDPVNDLKPVGLIVDSPLLIITRKEMPAQDLNELITWLKANPDRASQGTAGVASASHLAGVLFQKETGTRFQFVPYRGLAPALQDLLAGRTDLMFDLVADSLPQLRAGSIKAYAVTARRRLTAAPSIPTVDEVGLTGLYVSSWQALWAPKATPKSVIDKLNAAVVDALSDPAIRQRLVDLGQEIPPREQQTPEALGIRQTAELETWRPIIKAADIKAE